MLQVSCEESGTGLFHGPTKHSQPGAPHSGNCVGLQSRRARSGRTGIRDINFWLVQEFLAAGQRAVQHTGTLPNDCLICYLHFQPLLSKFFYSVGVCITSQKCTLVYAPLFRAVCIFFFHCPCVFLFPAIFSTLSKHYTHTVLLFSSVLYDHSVSNCLI